MLLTARLRMRHYRLEAIEDNILLSRALADSEVLEWAALLVVAKFGRRDIIVVLIDLKGPSSRLTIG